MFFSYIVLMQYQVRVDDGESSVVVESFSDLGKPLIVMFFRFLP